MLTLKFFKREPKDWTTTEIKVLEVVDVRFVKLENGYNVFYTNPNGIQDLEWLQANDPDKRDQSYWDWCVVENAAGRTTQKLDPASPERLAA